ncbi:MAG: LD-carboxypeptidase [Acidothermales bacterium]|nr:LD-carboxypeptidase [Acidothermales bacterium]
MRVPPKPRPGDRVAVVSPSAGLPAIFPVAYQLGLPRIRDVFGFEPVQYATTRTMNAPPADRAADLHLGFADPGVRAVLATIGGEDEITVLPHLDAELLAANPKPFLGFSDDTCLLTYLYDLGVVGYHGGHVMNAFARSGRMHPTVEASLRAALLTTGEYELPVADAFRDADLPPWDDPAFADTEPELEPAEGWTWHNADRVVEGTSERYTGGVLFVETSEELPSAVEVYRTLRNMGERGLLRQFPAVLVGRAKAWSLGRRTTPDERAAYRREQRDAVLRAFGAYAPEAVLVLGVDLAHTRSWCCRTAVACGSTGRHGGSSSPTDDTPRVGSRAHPAPREPGVGQHLGQLGVVETVEPRPDRHLDRERVHGEERVPPVGERVLRVEVEGPELQDLPARVVPAQPGERVPADVEGRRALVCAAGPGPGQGDGDPFHVVPGRHGAVPSLCVGGRRRGARARRRAGGRRARGVRREQPGVLQQVAGAVDLPAADDDVVVLGDERAHGREVAATAGGGVPDEAEHGAPEGTDEDAAEDEAEPDVPPGEQAHEQADEQAEPRTARGARGGRPALGQPARHALDEAQVGADDVDALDGEVLVGEAVDGGLCLLVGLVPGDGVPRHCGGVEAR